MAALTRAKPNQSMAHASNAPPTRLRHKKDVDVQTGNELKHGSYKCKIPVFFVLPPKNLNIPPSLKTFKTKKSGKKNKQTGQKTKLHNFAAPFISPILIVRIF